MNNQKQIKKYYEDFYTRAPEARKGFDMKRIRTNLSGFHIKKGSRVIDIGCGTGGTLTYLEENGLIDTVMLMSSKREPFLAQQAIAFELECIIDGGGDR